MKNKSKKKERLEIHRHQTIEIDLENKVTIGDGFEQRDNTFWLIKIWNGKPKNNYCTAFSVKATGDWSKDLPKVYKQINQLR